MNKFHCMVTEERHSQSVRGGQTETITMTSSVVRQRTKVNKNNKIYITASLLHLYTSDVCLDRHSIQYNTYCPNFDVETNLKTILILVCVCLHYFMFTCILCCDVIKELYQMSYNITILTGIKYVFYRNT